MYFFKKKKNKQHNAIKKTQVSKTIFEDAYGLITIIVNEVHKTLKYMYALLLLPIQGGPVNKKVLILLVSIVRV